MAVKAPRILRMARGVTVVSAAFAARKIGTIEPHHSEGESFSAVLSGMFMEMAAWSEVQ